MNGVPELPGAKILGEVFKTHVELELRHAEKKLGSLAIAQALEQLEMFIGVCESLTDEEFLILHGLDNTEDEYGQDKDSSTPLDLLNKVNAEFIGKASNLFGEINGYGLGGVQDGYLGIRSGGMFSDPGETTLSLDVSDGEVSFSKELRWINERSVGRMDLAVTNEDKKLLAQAVIRLISIDQQLQAEI